MEKREFPWGRVAAAGVMLLLLNLAGVVWLSLSQERLRLDLAALDQEVRSLPAPPTCADPTALTADIAALRQTMTGLAAKVDGLRAPASDAKALERLAAEVKNLSGRVDALAAAAKAPAKTGKTTKPASRVRPQTAPYPGPVYPGWPGY